MTTEEITNAIVFIRPGAEFIVRGEEVEWLDENQNEPTKAEIQAGLIAYNDKLKADKAAAAAKKAAAEAKLGALGLTADDLKALGL